MVENLLDFLVSEGVVTCGFGKLLNQHVDVFEPVKKLGHGQFIILADSLQVVALIINRRGLWDV